MGRSSDRACLLRNAMHGSAGRIGWILIEFLSISGFKKNCRSFNWYAYYSQYSDALTEYANILGIFRFHRLSARRDPLALAQSHYIRELEWNSTSTRGLPQRLYCREIKKNMTTVNSRRILTFYIFFSDESDKKVWIILQTILFNLPDHRENAAWRGHRIFLFTSKITSQDVVCRMIKIFLFHPKYICYVLTIVTCRQFEDKAKDLYR